MSIVFALRLNELDNDNIFKNLSLFVSYKRRYDANRYLFKDDAKRSIGAELLIRHYLISNQIMSNNEIEFVYNCYGKPYIKGMSDLFFNISHSGEWIVCGWSDKEIGIDVEKIKMADISIAKSHFCPIEYKYITINKNCQNERFMKIWTLKESFVKYLGKGLNMPFNSFLIKEKADGFVLDNEMYHGKVFLKLTSILNGYYLTECCEDSSDIEIVKLHIDDLVNVFNI